MSSNVGDIVATFGLDGRKWFEEAKKIQESATNLGVQVQKGLSGKLAVDTLSSGLSGGLTSAVSTATASIQPALASRFGAIGAGVGVIAGVAIVEGIKSLMSEADAFTSVSASAEVASRSLDQFIARQERIISFEGRVGELRTDAGADATGKSIDEQLGANERRLDGLMKRDRDLSRQITDRQKDLKANENAGGFRGFIAGKLGFDTGAAKIQSDIDALKGQLSKNREQIADVGADRGALQKQKEALDAERGNITDRQSEDEAKRIRSADPFLSRQKQLEDIARLTAGSFLERPVGIAAAQRLVGEFRQSVTQPIDAGRPNTANIAGTAASFSALQASIRQERSTQDQISETARQQLAMLERILDAIENPPKDEGVDI